jgi:signal peptidase
MTVRHTFGLLLRTGGSIFTAACILLVAAVAGTNFYFRNDPKHLPGLGPYKALIVLSDSMKPVFSAGDLIIVDASWRARYEINDILTFWLSENPPVLLTHRVTGTEAREGRTYYRTKGDANGAEDATAVPHEKVAGRYLWKIPRGGYAASFVRTRTGFALLVFLPAVFVFTCELDRVLPGRKKRR